MIIGQKTLRPLLLKIMPPIIFMIEQIYKIYSKGGGLLKGGNKSYGIMQIKCVDELLNGNFRAVIVEKLLEQNTKPRFFVANIKSLKELIRPIVPSAVRHFFSDIMGKLLPKPVHIIAVGNLEEEEVYRLTVEKAHLYYANNALVTNTDGNDHAYDAIRCVFLEWGKPRGSGGGVRPPYPDRRRTAPTILDGQVPAVDIKTAQL